MGILRRQFPLVFACVFATLTTLTVYHYLTNRENVSIATPVLTSPVVIAKSELQIGKKLTAQDLMVQNWPVDAAGSQYFKTVEQLIGRTLRTNLIAQEPITATKLLPDGDTLAALIPSNMRGVSVSIPKSSALADVLGKDTLVDVIAMIDNGENKMNAKVIAQRIKVLTINEVRSETGISSPHMEVLLLVSPSVASWIAYVQNHGSIELVVRNEL